MPTRGIMFTQVQNALDRELITNQFLPTIIRTHDLPLPLSRNFLMESALKVPDWKYVLMLDDDVILPKGALKEMIGMNVDVAVMDYPMHVKYEGKGVGTIVHDKDKTVGYAGLGAVLVKREAIEKIPSPWFICTQYKVNRSKDNQLVFGVGQPDGQPMAHSAGEDTYFFLQCRKHGLKVKETKKTAVHAHLEQVVTMMHTNRYSRQHLVEKMDKIERESV